MAALKSISKPGAIATIEKERSRKEIPDFRVGDTLKVHARIIEGTKERIQVFEGVVVKRHKKNQFSATFTVRKVSYGVGVERTFLLHSPRIDKIQVVGRGEVRRARLYYLRQAKGKAARIRTQLESGDVSQVNTNGHAEESQSEQSSNETVTTPVVETSPAS